MHSLFLFLAFTRFSTLFLSRYAHHFPFLTPLSFFVHVLNAVIQLSTFFPLLLFLLFPSRYYTNPFTIHALFFFLLYFSFSLPSLFSHFSVSSTFSRSAFYAHYSPFLFDFSYSHPSVFTFLHTYPSFPHVLSIDKIPNDV